MDQYMLFLDESTTHFHFTNKVFCIAGVIVKQEDYTNTIEPWVNRLKATIWADLPNPTDIVFHQKDIRAAKNCKDVPPEFKRFKKRGNCKRLYDELNNIFSSNLLTVVGSCIVMDRLNQYFHTDVISDEYLIGMQILFENYCHFLHKNNAVGSVYYEARQDEQNKQMRMRFNLIKAMGSMYISPYAMQEYLQEIYFPHKYENVVGLQLADFVPNDFARKVSGAGPNEFNVFNSCKRIRYNGGLPSKEDRFGMKVMP